MKPRISLITLGVDNLERSLKFYREGLGLASDGIIGTEFEHGAVAFFDLQNGLRMGIWQRKDIAHDSKLPLSPPSPTDFMIAHNVNSAAEVDSVMAEAKNAGAVILKPAAKAFWGGYSGTFQDPDQHLWEVAWNPEAMVSE